LERNLSQYHLAYEKTQMDCSGIETTKIGALGIAMTQEDKQMDDL
jgi:hypothetical protein